MTTVGLPVVDLEALGLMPRRQQGAALANGHRPRSGHGNPASPEIKTEFARLVAKLGIILRRGGRELVKCTQHEDRTRSLTVDYDQAWLRCHSTSSGCPLEGTHGVRFLRQFLDEEPLPRARRSESAVKPGQGGHGSRVHPENERSRLMRTVKETIHAFDRTTGRDLWEKILECHVAQVKYECVSLGHRIAVPFSCGFPICPICMPTRLRADFRRHTEHLPARLALFLVTPPEGVKDRTDIGSWFRRWRRNGELSGGFYGQRFRVGRPDVLLVLPADEVPAGLVSDTHATLVAADVSLDQAVDWYVDMFLEETASWTTPEEMLILLTAVKGRRRFQGFGQYYANKEGSEKTASENPDDEQLFTEKPKKLYRASGGSAKGGSKAITCPICGSRMRAVGIAPSSEGMEWDAKYNCRRWGTGPPSRAAHDLPVGALL